ncbi:GrpB family protein, partial [Acinetobacter nosocomialis]|uniref:GrpB family protein n=1 Tax=Acinetobacter nosocomialis TaxID=106654 RepID=UPI0013D3B2E5
MFERNESSYKSPSFASFRKDTTPSLGIQLVVAQSELDVFVRFRDILRSDQHLLERYNALKLNYQNASMQDYRIAKSEFIQLALNR